MKSLLRTFILLLSLVIAASSCNKSSNHAAKHLMQAKVNGTLVTCDAKAYVRQDLGGKACGIVGSQNGGNTFTITCPMTPGNWQFLQMYNGTECEAFYTANNNINQYHCMDGSITVTLNSGHYVKGTFSFRASNYPTTDTLLITEGMFDIDY